MAGRDKWEVIDKQVSSMLDFTNDASNALLNQRQGHTHRRSEPDVVMIRRAQDLSRNNAVQLPVPQSAPVQPGGFQLDWNSKPKRKLASTEDEPAENVNFIQETPNLIQFSDLDTFTANRQSETNPHTTVPTISHRPGSSDPAQLISVNGPGISSFDTPPKPPPYSQIIGNGLAMPNWPYEPVAPGFHPQPLAPELSYNGKRFTSTKVPQSNNFGYQSPRQNRRSSVPVNQTDPSFRAHSASPSITRRSTSIVNRRVTHDNFMNIPSIVHNTDMNPVGNHPSISVGPTSIFPLKPPPDNAITSFSALPSEKADDQEYTKVLLQHQRDRMQRLHKELEVKKKLLESLSTTVTAKEKEVFEKRSEKTSTNIPTLNDVTKLRELNRQMEIDCNCMIKEVDMVSESGNSVAANFHEYIVRNKNPGAFKNRKHVSDLPSPPLPPPPVPPPIETEDDTKWSCKWCTFLNHAALNKCEMCEYRRDRATTSTEDRTTFSSRH